MTVVNLSSRVNPSTGINSWCRNRIVNSTVCLDLIQNVVQHQHGMSTSKITGGKSLVI